jgi:2-oxoglutarate ferredoxin oxidoreductase subunit beta
MFADQHQGNENQEHPYGSVENPINPIPMAIVGGATYVARAFSGKQKHMVEMFKGAIQHKGSPWSMFQSLCHL